jgi:hypothetical protein
MKKEYEIIDGIKYPILWRKKGSHKSDKCPFCGLIHMHGSGEGHRGAHCRDTFLEDGTIVIIHGFLTSDGTYFPPSTPEKLGYILREY